jgi:hypothetical protein
VRRRTFSQPNIRPGYAPGVLSEFSVAAPSHSDGSNHNKASPAAMNGSRFPFPRIALSLP